MGGGELIRGGQSSAVHGAAAAASKPADYSAGEALCGAADVIGTLTRPNGHWSNAGDKLLRRSISAPVEEAVRGLKRHKEEEETAWKLTAVRARWSASSGRGW